MLMLNIAFFIYSTIRFLQYKENNFNANIHLLCAGVNGVAIFHYFLYV